MTEGALQSARPPFLPPSVKAFLQRRLWQAAGLALIAAVGALWAALASYHPADPSPLMAAERAAANWLGRPGAAIADLALQAAGAVAALAALAPALWGLRLVALRPLPRPRRHAAAWLAALPALATGLAALPAPAAWPVPAGLGGALGTLAVAGLSAGLATLWAGLPAWPAALAVGLGGVGLLGYSLGVPARYWRRAGRASLAVAAAAYRRLRRLPAATHAASRPTRRSPAAPDTAEAPGAPAHAPEPAEAVSEAEPARSAAVAERPKRPKKSKKAEAERQAELPIEPEAPQSGFALPPVRLLAEPPAGQARPQEGDTALQASADMLETTLKDFGVKGQIVKVHPGPVVTLYELEPAPGIKSSRVISLADDIARSMAAVSARVAVIPGRNVIGIELPNRDRETVYLGELLATEDFVRTGAKIPLVLGKTIGGQPVVADLARMPHLLVAGTTGSGKSVSVNAMILSLLYRLRPEQCRFIMVDPKMLELSVYEGIPHLLSPVVTDPKKAVTALRWVVREMEERYRNMSKLGVRNIEGYNARLRQARETGESLTRRVQTGYDPDTGKPVFEDQPVDLTEVPYIVVVVDEIADLMLVAGKDVEAAIQRLAQMARAAGIHLIMSTQRPSVDVITGTIKANFPTRISFQVTSKVDSRTVLGEQGAEQLLGNGDMLFMPGGARMQRLHGPFVADDEVEEVVAHLKAQGEPEYVEGITDDSADTGTLLENAAQQASPGDSGDELYDRAVAIVTRERKASTSFVQRQLQIGYNRAARLIERMETEGVISPANSVGKREVLAAAPPGERDAS